MSQRLREIIEQYSSVERKAQQEKEEKEKAKAKAAQEEAIAGFKELVESNLSNDFIEAANLTYLLGSYGQPICSFQYKGVEINITPRGSTFTLTSDSFTFTRQSVDYASNLEKDLCLGLAEIDENESDFIVHFSASIKVRAVSGTRAAQNLSIPGCENIEISNVQDAE